MTTLLVRVHGPDEADLALSGGADGIELLGEAGREGDPVSCATLAAVMERVAGRRPVWAALGASSGEPGAMRAAVTGRGQADGLRIGFSPLSAAAWPAAIADVRDMPVKPSLIAVFPAGGEPDAAWLAECKGAGFAAAAVETRGDRAGGILSQTSPARLAAFVSHCRAAGLAAGFGGALEAPDIPRLLALRPDHLGFRGPLTRTDTAQTVDPAAIAAIRTMIEAEAQARTTAWSGDTDRIFVRGLTLALEIGAYGSELGRTQRVRFGVEADIRRTQTETPTAGMAGLYSYDLITDAIGILAARGHTAFVETLAEDLAATLLVDRRVAAVTITVEKLDLGPASAGIEIRRTGRS